MSHDTINIGIFILNDHLNHTKRSPEKLRSINVPFYFNSNQIKNLIILEK